MTTEQPTTLKLEFLYEDLTFRLIGILIEVHKELGPYAREKQVGDLFATQARQSVSLRKHFASRGAKKGLIPRGLPQYDIGVLAVIPRCLRRGTFIS